MQQDEFQWQILSYKIHFHEFPTVWPRLSVQPTWQLEVPRSNTRETPCIQHPITSYQESAAAANHGQVTSHQNALLLDQQPRPRFSLELFPPKQQGSREDSEDVTPVPAPTSKQVAPLEKSNRMQAGEIMTCARTFQEARQLLLLPAKVLIVR